jgi:hydroxyacylglutathione hydrolase
MRMIFRAFHYYDSGCAAYLFGCGGLGLCAVVDPQLRDINHYAEVAAAHGMRITHVIDTHIHADHISGGAQLAARVGASYCLHVSAPFGGSFEKLHDGQTLIFGNTQAKVLHTPGHSAESLCLLVTDLRRGDKPWFVLTGDTLFVGSVGRPDLLGGERFQDQAALLHQSLHTKLMPLADDVEIYPGHFAGSACGAGMSGKPSSTIGFERRWNPMLGYDRVDFVNALATAPPKPHDMSRIIKQNQAAGSSTPARDDSL